MKPGAVGAQRGSPCGSTTGWDSGDRGERVLDQEGASQLGKPVGTYLTLTLGQLPGDTGDTFERTVRAVAEELREAATGGKPSRPGHRTGQRDITRTRWDPSPWTAPLATWHLIHQAAEYFGDYLTGGGGGRRGGGQHRRGERRADPGPGPGN